MDWKIILAVFMAGGTIGLVAASLCGAAKRGDTMGDSNLNRNGSGCKDPTACKAIKNVSKELNHGGIDDILNPLIKAARAMFGAAGFEIVGRIALKNTKTGKEYR